MEAIVEEGEEVSLGGHLCYNTNDHNDRRATQLRCNSFQESSALHHYSSDRGFSSPCTLSPQESKKKIKYSLHHIDNPHEQYHNKDHGFCCPVVGKSIYKEEELDECHICLMEYNNNKNGTEKVTTLPCGHYFHSKCLKEWSEKSKTCPMCRCELKSFE